MSNTPHVPSEESLPPDVAAALDRYLEIPFGDEKEQKRDEKGSEKDQKSAKIRALLDAINVNMGQIPPVPADLLQRTLARISALPLPEKTRITPAISQPKWWGRYVREIGAMAVAASILVMVCALGIHQARQSGNRVACAENMGTLATAFNTYGSLNDHALPQLAKSHDANWLRDNPQNLLPLFNASLIRPANLICPAMPGETGSGYSYVNLFGPKTYKWDGDHATMVLADRNPLFANPGTKDPNSNSLNHDARGTYLLRGDGSVTWETSPNIGPANDNIWTLSRGGQVQISYAGTEVATSINDVFLSP